jgi:hypothetical protein
VLTTLLRSALGQGVFLNSFYSCLAAVPLFFLFRPSGFVAWLVASYSFHRGLQSSLTAAATKNVQPMSQVLVMPHSRSVPLQKVQQQHARRPQKNRHHLPLTAKLLFPRFSAALQAIVQAPSA